MSSPSGLVQPELVQKQDRVLGGQVDEFGAKRSLDSRPRLSAALWRDRVLIGLGLLIVSCVVGFGLDLGNLAAQVMACWALLACLHVSLAITAGWVSRVPDVTTATRHVWAAISFAGVAYTVGDAIQLVMIATGPMSLQVALGGTAQSLSVLVGTAGLVMVMLISPIGLGPRERTRFWLDVSIVMAAATTFGAYAYVPADSSKLLDTLLSILIGPGLFLVGVFAVVKLVLSAAPPFSRLAGLTLAAAAALEGLVQASSKLMIDNGQASWVLGVTVIASVLLTGSSRIQKLQVRADPNVLHPRVRRRFTTLPYAAIAATYLLLVWVLAKVGLNAHVWIVVAGAIASTALVVGRQLVAFTDNTRLLNEVDAKVQELNQSLRERDLLATKLRHEAFHDPLTGLANRSMFNKRLQDALSGVGPATGHLTLMIVDLDDFKQVNDRYGHAAGDEVLVVTARRLRNCVREVDLVARLGGDEFAVLHEDLPDEAAQIAERIVEAVAQPFTVSAATASVTASVGVVVARGERRTSEQLMHAADTAMYVAKHSGKRGYRIV
jgi:diguanylate cyclase (GGDEF)-like protein